MKVIRIFVSDILVFLGVAVAYMIVIAGRLAGLEAFSKDALKKEIQCESCGMDMRIPSRHNADTIVKLEATTEKYNELIMHVASKHPGETRHETAARYITERENQNLGPNQENLENESDR